MKPASFFSPQFFRQRTENSASGSNAGTEYLRLQGHAAELHEQRLYLVPGGTLDVIAEALGGVGLGRIAYTPGLQAALKRSETFLTYRFTAPLTAQEGECFQVNCHGHDQLPAFHFVIEVGSMAP
ncbi:MAG: hypothetical protein Q8K32_17090 [Archangium sp.]|nr:hypothetical protein [Archangium sp.]